MMMKIWEMMKERAGGTPNMTTHPLSTMLPDKNNHEAIIRQRMETIVRLAHTMSTAERVALFESAEKLSDLEFAQTEEGQTLTTHFNAAIEKYVEKNRIKKQKNRKKKS